MIKKILYSFAFLLILLSASLFGEESVSAKRIISLGPTVTENLYLLGAGNYLIADTVYCKRPPDADKKEKIGTVTQVNSERIMSLKPDLVIATALTKPEQVKKLENLSLRVKVFPNPKNYSELCANFIKLGKLVGKEKTANDIVNMSRLKVNTVKAKIKNYPRPKVFIQIGAKPLFTATKTSFVNDFIDFAGGINIAANAETGIYSREIVLKANPDVILIVTMGITGDREKRIWEKYKTVNAVKNGRLYVIDSYKACSPTPETFVEALEEIVRCLHPEMEKQIEQKIK